MIKWCACACLVTKRYKINSNNCSLTSNYNTVCITYNADSGTFVTSSVVGTNQGNQGQGFS